MSLQERLDTGFLYTVRAILSARRSVVDFASFEPLLYLHSIVLYTFNRRYGSLQSAAE